MTDRRDNQRLGLINAWKMVERVILGLSDYASLEDYHISESTSADVSVIALLFVPF